MFSLGLAKPISETELEPVLANLPRSISITTLSKKKDTKRKPTTQHQRQQNFNRTILPKATHKLTNNTTPAVVNKLTNSKISAVNLTLEEDTANLRWNNEVRKTFQNAFSPLQNGVSTLQNSLLATIKSEPGEEGFEAGEDIWPMVATFQTHLHIDEMKGIKREILPFEMQDRLMMLMYNKKEVQPPCGCLQIGQSNLNIFLLNFKILMFSSNDKKHFLAQ